MKRIITCMLLICSMVLLLVGCGSKEAAPSTGSKAKVEITLVEEDASEYPYTIEVTEGTTLREALFESGLISEEEESAMFICDIDGHIADAIEDGVTWLPTDENGEQIMGTFDEITVSDGDHIWLVYTVVPNFDD